MSLTLYHHPIRQPSRAVHTLLLLGNILFQEKTLNPVKGQCRTPEYLELNPFGGIPFITHDKLRLSESNAILVHLYQSFPNQLKTYYGSNAEERDQINQYLSWYQGTYRPILMRPLKLRLEGLKKKKPVSKSALLQGENQINDVFKQLESFLSRGSGYLVGDSLSIADLLFYHQTTNVKEKMLAE